MSQAKPRLSELPSFVACNTDAVLTREQLDQLFNSNRDRVGREFARLAMIIALPVLPAPVDSPSPVTTMSGAA